MANTRETTMKTVDGSAKAVPLIKGKIINAVKNKVIILNNLKWHVFKKNNTTIYGNVFTPECGNAIYSLKTTQI